MRLQSKLFIAYLSLASIIFLSFASFLYFFISRQEISAQLESMDILNSSFQTQVDSSIRDMDNVSININYSLLSNGTLDSSFQLKDSKELSSELTDLFVAMNGVDWKSDQINLYDFAGQVLRVGLITKTETSDFTQSDSFDEIRELNGSKLISRPYQTHRYSASPTPEYNQWYISLYRTFSTSIGHDIGVIETVKKCSSLFKGILSYQNKSKNSSTQIYIYDSEGYLVYPYNLSDDEKNSLPDYYSLCTAQTSGKSFKNPINGQNEYGVCSVSSYTGFTYLTILPESVVLRPVNQLLKTLILIMALFIIAIVLISYKLSRSVVKPVKHLKHVIQRMELETLGHEKITDYPVSVNELEELYRVFENMSRKLKDSMDNLLESRQQELKSRTLALQSQINPHFYYNSLSSIIVLAENNQPDIVIKMCRNLSNIMRYITDSSSITVTLGDEIEYVKKYLYCMKVRYQSSLNYTIEVDDILLREPVPKLIIQPLVENAIKYGSDCDPPWHISVIGRLYEDHWQIDILDTGNGFSEEALKKIQDNIDHALANIGMPEIKIDGLGTLNVFLRWKIFCKDDIIFSCGNTEEGHGKVSIGRYTKSDKKKR